MTPALLHDLQTACYPYGIHPAFWAAALLGGIAVGYLLFKTLLHPPSGSSRLTIPTCILLLPTLTLFPIFSLLETTKRQKDLEILLLLLQNRQRTLLTIQENPKTLQKTYTLQKMPQVSVQEILGKNTQTIRTSIPFQLNPHFLEILKAHQILEQ